MEPTRTPASREFAEGVARDALFTAFFGTVWAAAGASALDGSTGVILLIVSVALAAMLYLGSVRLRRGTRGLSRDDSPQARIRYKHLSRRFKLVFGLQGIAIALAVVLLARYGPGSSIPAAVVLIVGVHFFPLARL